jgi:hypothetical protein
MFRLVVILSEPPLLPYGSKDAGARKKHYG